MHKLDSVLNYLASAEGLEVHYNSSESDITSPYGIYRHQHPRAAIFNTIDSVAKSVGVSKPSRSWSRDDLARVNNGLAKLGSEMRELAIEFYEDFLSDAMIESFPDECVLAMYSMYTNSPLNAVKAVQDSLLEIRAMNAVRFSGPLSIVDGVPGSKTKNAIIDIRDMNEGYLNLYFESLMLSNMKSIYIKLALANSDNLKYLRGWDARMDKLQSTK